MAILFYYSTFLFSGWRLFYYWFKAVNRLPNTQAAALSFDTFNFAFNWHRNGPQSGPESVEEESYK